MQANSSSRQPHFAAVIRQLRLKKRLTQEELALAIGASNSEISHYESGRRDLKLGTLQRLAVGLGVPYAAIAVMVEELESRAQPTRSSGADGSTDAGRLDELCRQVRWDFLVALELEGVVGAAAADRAEVGGEIEDL